jgi:hypothetical protein
MILNRLSAPILADGKNSNAPSFAFPAPWQENRFWFYDHLTSQRRKGRKEFIQVSSFKFQL